LAELLSKIWQILSFTNTFTVSLLPPNDRPQLPIQSAIDRAGYSPFNYPRMNKHSAHLRKRLESSAAKTVAIFHEVRRNSRSIASNFVENIGSFGKLDISGLDQAFPKNH